MECMEKGWYKYAKDNRYNEEMFRMQIICKAIDYVKVEKYNEMKRSSLKKDSDK